jgi:hypothetical protein
MQLQPSHEFCYVMVYQVHLTKSLFFSKPFKTIITKDAVYNLKDIFTTIGKPVILKSDN